MTIYRGPGGTGSASSEVDTTEFQEFLVQAQAAQLAAESALADAEAARDAALAAETNAELAEVNAETAETNAETAETNASASASAAASSASAAATSASNAASSASSAASSAASIDPANLVHISGTETITGAKTFSSTITGSVSGTAANVTGTVAVANGGTGATTASGARTNLDALAATNPSYTGTLTGGTGVVNLGSGQFYKDASGNVGIGTNSPSYKLDVTGQGRATTGFAVSTDGSTFTPSGLNAIPNYGLGYITSTSMPTLAGFGGVSFYTNQTERMRIDASGNLLVGTTSGAAQTNITATSAKNVMNLRNFDDAGRGVALLNSSGGSAGIITWTATTTTYATSSDYRLKNTIVPMTGALAKVAALKPCTYKWNVDGSDGQGFIAHELAEVVPGCVTGEKDAVDAEGNPKYQGIDTSFLVATLTAAIQEQQAIISALTARVEALEAA